MLFLDTEFNGFGGKLISMALLASDNTYFYEVVEMPDPVHPWVAEHVMPILGKSPLPIDVFKARLHAFLKDYQGAVIVADWHDDFIHFFQSLSGRDYGSSLTFSCTAKLVQDAMTFPDLPHNALSDAFALARWWNTYNA